MSAAPPTDAAAPRRPDLARFVLAALLAPCLLAVFSVWLGQEYLVTEKLRREARAAFELRSEPGSIIARVCDAESNERGYILTGDAGYLVSYQLIHMATLKAFDQLDIDSAGTPVEAAARAELRRLARDKFAEMDTVIADRRAHGLESAVALLRSDPGKALLDRMRSVSAAILAQALQKRQSQADRYGRRVQSDAIQTFVAIGTVGLLLVAAAVAMWRQRRSEYRAQVAAYSAAARNRAILHSTVDGIVIVDPDGKIETANAAAAAMLGYGPEELVGRDVGTLIRLPGRAIPFHRRIAMVDGHIAQPLLPDRKVLHRDGYELSVDITLGVMHLPDGDHFVASVHDISARKHVERMKDELISTVSHELRTPLTSVVGALGLLRSGAAGTIAPAPAQLIEIAENNSRRLIRLINDMLDIDRIQSGQWAFVSERTDLRQVVNQACEGIRGQAGAANVEVECAVPDTPVDVAGDADRLLQVLSNLTSNAIHVSKPGQNVRIGLSVGEPGKAIVTVDDDGPGVPIEFRDRIFGRFERADRGHGVGTGLGLAISREIIVRHAGRIWFEDRPGGGTRFAFSLDLLPARGVAPMQTDRIRLLICEDEADIAEMLRLIVSSLGFDVTCVGTIADARTALQDDAYRVLLLDMNLPDGTGSDLLRRLRASDGTLPLSVIVISAQARDRSKAPFAHDIVDWIQKPIDGRRLAEALRIAMHSPPVAT